MPVMPTWADYLPDWKQGQAVADEAYAKAKTDAATLADMAPDAVSERLAAAAAEAVRLMVLVKPDAMGIVLKYQEALHRLLRSLESLTNPFGALAFANVVLTHAGVWIDGYMDGSTRSGLEREVAAVERFARSGKTSRELAFVAIGLGRSDLARALTGDRIVLRLADACDAKEAPAFYDFVAAFPDMDVGYAELLFVARAYVVVLEERGVEGIGMARGWLHGAVHQGPKPLVPHRPVVYAPPPPLVMPEVTTGPSPFAWSTIAMSDIHGLWGGYAMAISSIGDVEAIDTMKNKRARATLDAAQLSELDAVVARHPVRTMEVPRGQPIPDETTASITIVEASGAEHSVWKLASVRHESFSALWSYLMGIATRVLG